MTYWVAVKFYRGTSDVMLRQNLQKNPSSIKQTMKRYGGKLVAEGKNIMIFSGTKGSFVWVRQHIDDQTIEDCQQILERR